MVSSIEDYGALYVNYPREGRLKDPFFIGDPEVALITRSEIYEKLIVLRSTFSPAITSSSSSSSILSLDPLLSREHIATGQSPTLLGIHEQNQSSFPLKGYFPSTLLGLYQEKVKLDLERYIHPTQLGHLHLRTSQTDKPKRTTTIPPNVG